MMQAPTDQIILQPTRLDASHNQPQPGMTRLVWPLYPPTQSLPSGVEASAPLFVSCALTGTPPLSRSSSRTSTAASSSSLATPILQSLITPNILQGDANQYNDALDPVAPLSLPLAPPFFCVPKISTGIQSSLSLPPSQQQSVYVNQLSGSYLPAPGGSGSHVGDMSSGEAEVIPQAAPSGLPVSYEFTFSAYPQMQSLQDTFAPIEQAPQSTPQFSENFGVQTGSVYQQHASRPESYLLNGVNLQSTENPGVQAAPAYQQDGSNSGNYLNGVNLYSSEDAGVQLGPLYQQHTSDSEYYVDGANFGSPENLGAQATPAYHPQASNVKGHLSGATFNHTPEDVEVQVASVYQQYTPNSGNYLHNQEIPQFSQNLGGPVYRQRESNFGSHHHQGVNHQFAGNVGIHPGSVYQQHASSSVGHHLQEASPQFVGHVGMQVGAVYQQHASNSGSHHLHEVNPQFVGNVGMQAGPFYQQHMPDSGSHHSQEVNSQNSQYPRSVSVQPGSVYQQQVAFLNDPACLQLLQNVIVQSGPVYEQPASNSGNNVAAASVHHAPNVNLSVPSTSSGINPTYQSVFSASINSNSNVPRANDSLVQTTASDANPEQGTLPTPSAALYVQQIQPSGGLSTVSARSVGGSDKRTRAEFEGKDINGSSQPPKKQAKTLPMPQESNANAAPQKPKRVVKVKERKRGTPCPICGKPVTPGRRRHHEMTTTHLKAVLHKYKILGKWVCGLCCRRFTRNDACFRHQERRHGGRFPDQLIYDPQWILLEDDFENDPPQSQ
ncbi:hypothetical protein EDD17DRAFT_1096887 [Pisolithus thermaeus]|nr:hypothetical protein EV401DRAFT_960891 [Pisolithus croceorrhizus]KAI6166858.1 hypothetical protein EDD17DRAFT_1096887 [Pisolithus thermaeus]